MGKFLNMLKKGLSMGTIDTQSEGTSASVSSKPNRITNKILLHELVEHFNEQMEELSVNKRILYPMSFNILMHPDDYNQTKQSLPFVLPEVVAEFYASIKRKKNEFRGNVNYTPPATYWFFQFSACEVSGAEGEEDFIQRGKIVTTGNLVTFDIFKAQGNVHSDVNVHLSVKCQNSNTNDNNINMDAILGMNILSEGSYTFDFDQDMNEDTSLITAGTTAPKTSTKGRATLKWSGGSNNLVFDMLDDYIDISGPSDTRQTRKIFHIPDDAVSTSHVQIKFDQATQTFMLAAFAKTRLNSREIAISTGDPQWVTLANNSHIFLNDSANVEFTINK